MSYDLVTDRSKGTNNFDPERRSVLISGIIADAPDLVLNTETKRFRYSIPFREARVITAMGYEPKLPNGEAKVTYAYGKAVERNGALAPEAPRKESVWFDGVEPAFVGEDLELASAEGRRDWVGMEMLLVEHDVPKLNREGKTFPLRKRYTEGTGPDSNDPLNAETNERGQPFNKGGVFEYERDEDGAVVMKEGRPTFVMSDNIAMWDQVMLPLDNAVEGALVSKAGTEALAIFNGGVQPSQSGQTAAPTSTVVAGESADDAVVRIWGEHGSENNSAFRRSALANKIILADPVLKASLTLGQYEGPAVSDDDPSDDGEVTD